MKTTHPCFDERQKRNHEKQLILVLKKDKKETLTFFLANFSCCILAYDIKNIVLNFIFRSSDFPFFMTLVSF